jgi:hypothetical protein
MAFVGCNHPVASPPTILKLAADTDVNHCN